MNINRSHVASGFSTFIRWVNNLGVGAAAPFSLAQIFLMAGLALEGIPGLFFAVIALTWGLIAIGNHFVYQAKTPAQDPLRKPFWLTKKQIKTAFEEYQQRLKIWSQLPFNERTKQFARKAKLVWADGHGLAAAALKGLVYGFAGYFALAKLGSLLLLTGAISVPFAPGALLAVGVCIGIAGLIIQATKLISKAEEIYGVNGKQALSFAEAKKPKSKKRIAAKLPFVIGHALGQCTPVVMVIVVLLQPVVSIPGLIALSLLGALIVSPPAGWFYGKKFLEEGNREHYNLKGMTVGGAIALFKGALAFVGTVASVMFFMGVSLLTVAVPWWLLGVAAFIGLSFALVQAPRLMAGASLHFAKSGKGDEAKKALLGQDEKDVALGPLPKQVPVRMDTGKNESPREDGEKRQSGEWSPRFHSHDERTTVVNVANRWLQKCGL